MSEVQSHTLHCGTRVHHIRTATTCSKRLHHFSNTAPVPWFDVPGGQNCQRAGSSQRSGIKSPAGASRLSSVRSPAAPEGGVWSAGNVKPWSITAEDPSPLPAVKWSYCRWYSMQSGIRRLRESSCAHGKRREDRLVEFWFPPTLRLRSAGVFWNKLSRGMTSISSEERALSAQSTWKRGGSVRLHAVMSRWKCCDLRWKSHMKSKQHLAGCGSEPDLFAGVRSFSVSGRRRDQSSSIRICGLIGKAMRAVVRRDTPRVGECYARRYARVPRRGKEEQRTPHIGLEAGFAFVVRAIREKNLREYLNSLFQGNDSMQIHYKLNAIAVAKEPPVPRAMLEEYGGAGNRFVEVKWELGDYVIIKHCFCQEVDAVAFQDGGQLCGGYSGRVLSLLAASAETGGVHQPVFVHVRNEGHRKVPLRRQAPQETAFSLPCLTHPPSVMTKKQGKSKTGRGAVPRTYAGSLRSMAASKPPEEPAQRKSPQGDVAHTPVTASTAIANLPSTSESLCAVADDWQKNTIFGPLGLNRAAKIGQLNFSDEEEDGFYLGPMFLTDPTL
ncbi:hypothetical protein B0H17DRAFT_1155325, partial [Mycena rosella]